MNNEYLADEKAMAPDLSIEVMPPRVEVKGVAAYVVAYAAKSHGWREHDLYYLHAFGSLGAMEAIRAFGMEPQGTVLRIEEPNEDPREADTVRNMKVPPDTRKGWKVHRTRHVDVPGGRAYTTYETVIQHGSVNFHHDPMGKCVWPPERFILLARTEEEAPRVFFEKLSARSKLPIHRAFAEPLWKEFHRTHAIKKLLSHGVVAYEATVPDATLAAAVKRLGEDGMLPTAESILGIPEPDRFADSVDLYEEASFNPNPMAPVGAY